MPDFRYAQFCPIARASEILAERWTPLIARELLIGPQRFSDLKQRLAGVSTSVLSARLAGSKNVRHLLLVILLQEFHGFGVTPYLVAAFLLNSVSMLVPFAMPHLVRAMTKSATAIVCVNVALVIAWRIPATVPFIAAAFLGTYLYSFAAGGLRRLRRA